MKRRLVVGAVLLSALVCAFVLAVRSQRSGSQIDEPTPGEEVTVLLRYGPSGRGTTALHREARLLVRCVTVRDHEAKLRVFYSTKGMLGKARYTVVVRYDADDAFATCSVTDSHGREIPRGGNVDGIPVPFTDLLGVYPYRSSVSRRLPAGGSVHLTRFSAGRAWRLRLAYIDYPIGNPPRSFTENQYWPRSGSWMWGSASRYYDEPSGGLDYTAEREPAAH